MHSLLIVAHGSRRDSSNDEVRALTECLRQRAGARFARVSCAFLELAEPSIPDGIDALVEAGTRRVTVLPYFLSAGRHVATDIPEAVERKRRQYPSVHIELASYVGASEGMIDLLLGHAALSRGPAS